MAGPVWQRRIWILIMGWGGSRSGPVTEGFTCLPLISHNGSLHFINLSPPTRGKLFWHERLIINISLKDGTEWV